MGYLKVLIVASIWLFLVLFIILNRKFRDDIIFLSNITLFKHIKLKNIAAVFTVLVVLFYSCNMLKDAKILKKLIKQKS